MFLFAIAAFGVYYCGVSVYGVTMMHWLTDTFSNFIVQWQQKTLLFYLMLFTLNLFRIWGHHRIMSNSPIILHLEVGRLNGPLFIYPDHFQLSLVPQCKQRCHTFKKFLLHSSLGGSMIVGCNTDCTIRTCGDPCICRCHGEMCTCGLGRKLGLKRNQGDDRVLKCVAGCLALCVCF